MSCRNNNSVAGIGNRRIRDCEDVFECLEELLEDELGENNRRRNCANWEWEDNVAGTGRRRIRDCEDVFECLAELLEDALGENDRRRRRRRCR